ncbi:hypothetical protein D3C86_1033200 [compost metagenome]
MRSFLPVRSAMSRSSASIASTFQSGIFSRSVATVVRISRISSGLLLRPANDAGVRPTSLESRKPARLGNSPSLEMRLCASFRPSVRRAFSIAHSSVREMNSSGESFSRSQRPFSQSSFWISKMAPALESASGSNFAASSSMVSSSSPSAIWMKNRPRKFISASGR